jgi:hypothetical protein
MNSVIDENLALALFGYSKYLEDYNNSLPASLTIEEWVKAGVYALFVQNGYWSSWYVKNATVEEVEGICSSMGLGFDVYVCDNDYGCITMYRAFSDDEEAESTEEVWNRAYEIASEIDRKYYDAARKIMFG